MHLVNIFDMERERFLEIRNRFLTSAIPIQSTEHLKGRNKSLNALVDALSSPGRHAFVYGFRGVGKTSLSQTAAFQLQHSAGSPILLSCDSSSSFGTLCSGAITQAMKIDPLERKGQLKLNIGGTIPGIGGANVTYEQIRHNLELEIKSANAATAYFKAVTQKNGFGLIIVIDEFDNLTSNDDHKKFATLVKILSDQNIPVKFIFCGIADEIERLFSAHESISRQIHSEKVDQLNFQARLDIINDAEKALKITMKKDFKFRIAQISDGFPAFIHLIAEKTFTSAFDADEKFISDESYVAGLQDACSSIEFSMKNRYEKPYTKILARTSR